jgi:hypothetical protein
MILYKYFSPDRIDVLKNAELRFTQPEEFNDAFDSAPLFDRLGSKDAFKEISDESYPWASPELRDKILRDTLAPENAYIVNRLTRALMRSGFGVLSLSESCDNVLMWSHYARSHEGFVIGFNADSGYFADANPVVYSSERPKRTSMVELTKTEVFYTKSKEWKYEREWRVVRLGSDATRQLKRGKDRLPIYLFTFPKASVSRVILGARSNESVRRAILKAIKRDNYKGVSISEGVLGEEDFSVRIRPYASRYPLLK